MMNSFGYRPTILRPTRVTATSFTIIDKIWTNDYENVKASGILRCCPSDYFPLIVSVKSGRRTHDQNFIVCKVRRNNVNSHNEFRHMISSAPGLDAIPSQNVQYLYDKFSEKLNNAYDCAYPMIEIKRKLLDISKPYVTVELKNLSREKNIY